MEFGFKLMQCIETINTWKTPIPFEIKANNMVKFQLENVLQLFMVCVDCAHENKNELEMCADAQRDGRLPNMGGALCSTPQSLADAHCQNAVQ